jgi:hypothetical protein
VLLDVCHALLGRHIPHGIHVLPQLLPSLVGFVVQLLELRREFRLTLFHLFDSGLKFFTVTLLSFFCTLARGLTPQLTLCILACAPFQVFPDTRIICNL